VKRSRTYAAEGLVLRSRVLGETDRLIVLYTVEEGKLSAVAKGARRANSKLAAAVQSFAYGRYGLARGKSLDVVTQCQLRDSFYGLRTDLDRLTAGCAIAELVDRVVDDRHPDEQLFNLILGALRALRETTDPELTQWAFELSFMAHLGYAPVLDACARCGNTDPAGARMSVAFGGRLCAQCLSHDPGAFPVGRQTVQVLRRLTGASGAASPAGPLAPRTREELRRTLGGLVEHRFDIRLRSREFAERIGLPTGG